MCEGDCLALYGDRTSKDNIIQASIKIDPFHSIFRYSQKNMDLLMLEKGLQLFDETPVSDRTCFF
jgi:hypothetical protein